MAEGPVTYTDKGGGGPNPPHGEDFFNRIVGVHWRKKAISSGIAIFAMGDRGGSACYVGGAKVDDPSGKIVPANVVPLGTLGFGESGNAYGSSCHVFKSNISGVDDRAVYLLCGDKNFEPAPGDDGIILASTDGLNWLTVYTMPAERSGYEEEGPGTEMSSWVFAIVWDGDAFYAGAHKWINIYVDRDDSFTYLKEAKEVDVLLTSSDGMSWSEAGSQSFVTYSGSDGYTAGTNHGDPPWGENGLLASHCRDGIPDGFSYYFFDRDAETEIFIRPGVLPRADYNYGDISAPSPDSSVLIDINITGQTSISRESSPGFPVTAVAFSGGVIVAVGGTVVESSDGTGPSEFAVSYDRGETWVSGSYDGRPPVSTVCGKA